MSANRTSQNTKIARQHRPNQKMWVLITHLLSLQCISHRPQRSDDEKIDTVTREARSAHVSPLESCSPSSNHTPTPQSVCAPSSGLCDEKMSLLFIFIFYQVHIYQRTETCSVFTSSLEHQASTSGVCHCTHAAVRKSQAVVLYNLPASISLQLYFLNWFAR